MVNKLKKVLAIDDNRDNLITIKALINEIFPEIVVLTAISGKEGIALACNEVPDVILLDVLMPEMDSFDVCKVLKAEDALHGVPVVFVNALKTNKQSRVRAIEVGADGFLNKPIDESELAAQIRAMMKIRAAYVKDYDDRKLTRLVEERTEMLQKELTERNQARKELVFANRRLSAFWEIASIKNVDLNSMCNHLLEAVVTMSESTYGFFGFLNEDESVMTIHSWSGEAMKGCSLNSKPTEFTISEAGIWGEAIRRRGPLIVNNYRNDHPAKKGLPMGHVALERLLVIPVFTSDRIVSVTAVANRETDYDESDVRQITAFTENMQQMIDRKKIEAALEESEERYRRITEGITDYIYTVVVEDGKSISTIHSIACEKITGYTAKDFLNDPYLWINMVPDDERKLVILRAEEILEGKHVEVIEHHIIRKDGELRWVSDTAILSKNAQGTLLSYEGVVKDISEKKLIEDTQTFLLHCGHPNLGKKFFEQLAQYLALNLKMEYVCLVRLDGDGLTAHTVAVFNDGRFETNVTYALKDTPCGEVVGKQICCFPNNVGVLFPNDAALKDLNAESYIGTTLWSFDGKPIGLIAVIGRKPIKSIEIAERVLKLVALRAASELERLHADDKLIISNNKFRTIFEQAPLGIGLSDKATGQIIEVNTRFAEIIGRTPEMLATVDWMSITHPEDLEIDKHNYSLMKDGTIPGFSMQKRYLRPDGSYVWTQMTVATIGGSENEMSHHICMIEDITELRKIEARLRQSEKMEAVGTLAGGIAHDFNNVLGGIIGFTDMSLDYAAKGSPLEKNLIKVLKASDRAKHLVRQILTFSRQGSHQQISTLLLPIINEALELLRASIPSSVNIKDDLQYDTKPVMADPTQIHEMIINLATNAVYAMKNRGVLTVRLFTTICDGTSIGRTGKIPSGEYVVFEIGDTGSGVDPLMIQKIFEPFFTTKPVGEGTGMGLSVVLGVIQSHHGDLQIESEPGKGTMIRIFIPVSNKAGTTEVVDNKKLIIGGSERVLFVDDEKELVEIAEAMLGGIGYKVVGFTNSLKAQNFIKQKIDEIDVLITDQTMPGITGLELVATARKIRKDLPVILCTGFSREVTASVAKEMGNCRLIMKPYFGSLDIEQAIRDLMDSKE